jgi:hypothetical protein
MGGGGAGQMEEVVGEGAALKRKRRILGIIKNQAGIEIIVI